MRGPFFTAVAEETGLELSSAERSGGDFFTMATEETDSISSTDPNLIS